MSKPMTIKAHLQLKPDIKHILYGGKGGVGKTTLSVATAYWLAGLGRKVCVFSTDPQKSLTDIFERDIFGRDEIEITHNLHALEIDQDKRIAEYQEKIRRDITERSGLGDIPEEIEDYIRAMPADPAIALSATFDKMVELMTSGQHDCYVFDMVPHSHAIRFLGLSEIFKEWVNRLSDQGGSIKKDLEYIRSKLDFVGDMMRDEEHTAFFYVLVPEEIPILDTREALKKFAQFHIPISGVLVNMVYPTDLLEQPNVPPYLKSRIAMQQKHMEVIRREYGPLICGVVPMFAQEPKGLDKIARVAEALFGK
ncbi:MAG: ArsA family ATPase [Candidatus Bathyarchaeia archaeon]